MLRVLVCVMLVMGSQMTFADAEAEISYRKGVYRVVGGHMTAMSTILRNQVHNDELAYHMRGMAEVAKLAPGVFPAGSGDGKTSALPAIWEKPEEFQAAMDKFTEAAAKMGSLAGSDDMRAIGGAMKALGGSCKNCHDNFKAD